MLELGGGAQSRRPPGAWEQTRCGLSKSCALYLGFLCFAFPPPVFFPPPSPFPRNANAGSGSSGTSFSGPACKTVKISGCMLIRPAGGTHAQRGWPCHCSTQGPLYLSPPPCDLRPRVPLRNILLLIPYLPLSLALTPPRALRRHLEEA